MSIITSHQELANQIRGKKILHLNSLGKDAILCLDWLNKFATCEIISVFFKLDAAYPSDDKYLNFLKKYYPKTKFITVTNLPELTEKMQGMFQSPLVINYVLNNQEYEEFSFKKAAEELRVEYNCDFICSGISCYEGMGRALYLRRVGLMDEKRKMIYPIGLMKQAQVVGLISRLQLPLNPCYKLSDASHDSATYHKMRAAFKAKPDFKKTVYKHFPLLALDEYRYEVLFNDGKSK